MAPILKDLPDGATPSEIECSLAVPCTIWNAIVFDHAPGTQEYVTIVREAIANYPIAVKVTEELIENK